MAGSAGGPLGSKRPSGSSSSESWQDDEGRHPMVEVTMNGLQEMRKLIAEGDIDVLRTMVKEMAEALMGAEVDALCGASHGERHPQRTHQRHGYRARPWDTRAGT